MFYTGRPKSKFLKRFVGGYLFIGVLVLTFLGGIFVGRRAPGAIPPVGTAGGEVQGKAELPAYLLQDVDFDLFWEVWNIAKGKFLEQPVFDTQLFYGALQGIVASLKDPYSVFLDPETTKKFTEELAGTFEGIGAEIGIKKGELVVVAPLPETPAQRAGLKTGDRILKIDGEDTFGMPIDIAVSRIRGPKGTAVTLVILRQGWEESKDMRIMRETINVKSVQLTARQDGLTYLKITYFNETTLGALEEAIQQLLARAPKGIILDLRGNPGGFLEVAVRVAAEWIPSGEVVVWQEFQGGSREAFYAQGQQRLKEIPTVVLINEGSASASEIVAGALRDHGIAKVMGEKSFGNGSVQTFEQLRGGSSIKLTVAHWLTPKGAQIEKTGITPDLEIPMSRKDYENDKDPQLEKAVETLIQK